MPAPAACSGLAAATCACAVPGALALMGEAEGARRAAFKYVLVGGEVSLSESSEREKESSSQRKLFDLPPEQGKTARHQGRGRRTPQPRWGRWLPVPEQHPTGWFGGSKRVALRPVMRRAPTHCIPRSAEGRGLQRWGVEGRGRRRKGWAPA